MGRHTKLTPEIRNEAARLAPLGLTDKQLAAVFHVTEQTLNAWKKDEKFLESIKRKVNSDGEVERSLWERATGYSVESVKIFCNKNGEVTEVPYVEHYPPDPTSMIFWLKNRQPKKWRDRQEITGADGREIEIRMNFGSVQEADE